MTRQDANRIIARQISAMVEGAPDLRFHQILHCLHIEVSKKITENGKSNTTNVCEDLFNEESTTTLERMGIQKTKQS